MELPLPEVNVSDPFDAIEPTNRAWIEPAMIEPIAGRIRLGNNAAYPQAARKQDHIFPVILAVDTSQYQEKHKTIDVGSTPILNTSSHDQKAIVDPNGIVSNELRQAFTHVLQKYNTVFDSDRIGYNDKAEKIEAVVSISPIQPPNCKDHVPEYAKDKLLEVQMFDDREKAFFRQARVSRQISRISRKKKKRSHQGSRW